MKSSIGEESFFIDNHVKILGSFRTTLSTFNVIEAFEFELNLSTFNAIDAIEFGLK